MLSSALGVLMVAWEAECAILICKEERMETESNMIDALGMLVQ